MANFDKFKARYWELVVYPESLPLNWLDILKDPGNPVAISPLHDHDIVTLDDLMKDPDRHKNYNEGDIKKSHYHVLIAYSGPTTGNSLKTLYDLGSTRCMPFVNMRKRFEYLIHLNDPDKFQYDPQDIKYLNEFDINDYIVMTSEEKNEIIKQIISIVWDTHINNYSQLIDFFINDYPKFCIIKENAFFFTQYLKSMKLKDISVLDKQDYVPDQEII